MMKGRLPVLVQGLYEILGKDLLRAKGHQSITAFTLMVSAESVVTEVLQRHKHAPFHRLLRGLLRRPLGDRSGT